MKKAKHNEWMPILLLVLVLGGATWWYLGKNDSAGNAASPERMANNALHAAKEKAVKMTMKVASTSVTEIENGKIRIANRVIINNTMPLPLNASRLDYTVMAGKIKLAAGTYNKPIHIPAGGDTTLVLPMQVLVQPMDQVIEQANAAGRDSITYTFYNTIYTDVPIAGKRAIPFNLKETLPVVRLPELKPGDLDIDKLGLKRSAMDMVMHVKNPNPFTIRMRDGRYSMNIDGKHTMEGRMEKEVVLPPKQTTPVDMHMEMKTGRALKMGWKMLFDNTDTRYHLTFDSKIASDRKLLQNSSMHFTDEGTLHDLVKEVKKKVD